MDLIARNPYRVLGVFANDSNRIRTANIGKIRAFLKVGKDIHFDVDNINLLGPLDRSAEMIDVAIAQLSDRTEEVVQSLFWFHSNSITPRTTEETKINYAYALNQIPRDNKGELILEQAPSIEICYFAIIELSNGNQNLVNSFMDDKTSKAKKVLDEARKALDEEDEEIDVNKTPEQEAEEEKAKEQAVKDAEKELAFWKKVADFAKECETASQIGTQETLSNSPITSNSIIEKSYAEILNSAVTSLALEDYEATVRYYTIFFESIKLVQDFREAINFPLPPQGSTSNNGLVKLFINRLILGYSEVDWWPLFRKSSSNKSVLDYIKTIFEEKALEKIRENIEEAKNKKPPHTTDWLQVTQGLRRGCYRYVRVLQPLEHGIISAEAQLTLDRLSSEIIRECKIYYRVAKIINEQSVLPTAQLVEYALSIASGSDVIEFGTAFLNELKQDIEFLPPNEVKNEAQAIRNEINKFCNKPDEICWALILIKRCIPLLNKIREIVGTNNAYYINISTKIADNALYNSTYEMKTVISRYEANKTITNRAQLEETLRQAWELILYLRIFDLNEDFRKEKLTRNEESVRKELEHYGINYDDIKINIDFLTEEEVFKQCDSYESLEQFRLQYPHSQYIGQVIKKMWKIEEDNYPKVVTVRNLFAFKEKYPNSHKNSQVEKSLIYLLTIENLWTIYDYRHFLRLYPNYEKKLEILNRIDTLSFNSCKTIEDYKYYLLDFGNGAYRKKAKDRIEDLVYESAIISGKIEVYLSQYPNGRYVNQAQKAKLSQPYNRQNNQSQNQTHKGFRKRHYKKTDTDTKYNNIMAFLFIIFMFGLSYVIVQLITAPKDENKAISNENVTDRNDKPKLVWDDETVQGTSSIENNDATNNNETNGSETSSINASHLTESNKEDIEDVEEIDKEQLKWLNNSLSTGSMPYSDYFGEPTIGEEYILIHTKEGLDYIAIVRSSSNNEYINHAYIKGGETASLYLLPGDYVVYFYSGKGWNPYMANGNVMGGFVSQESSHKDKTITLGEYQYYEYTLYPVRNGNLRLKNAKKKEMFG